MAKLDSEASGKAATGEIVESTKTPADGAAEGDTLTSDPLPNSCDDKTQASCPDSSIQQETSETSTSNENPDNTGQSEDVSGSFSQSDTVSPDSSGQA